MFWRNAMSAVETHYAVSGMKCGGCEARAREAVSRLPGFAEARFDHKAGEGVVKGAVDSNAVIKALAAIGYSASRRSG